MVNEKQRKSEEKNTDNKTDVVHLSEPEKDAVREAAAMVGVEVQTAKRTLEKEGTVGKEVSSGAPPKLPGRG